MSDGCTAIHPFLGKFLRVGVLVRRCLLKILEDGLVDKFANESTSRLYFSQLGLTKTEIKKRSGGQAVFKCPKD